MKFSLIKKNKTRENAPWYIRRYDHGKVTDINLETTDRQKAEMELMKVKVASEMEGDPLDALSVRRKHLSEPISAPGGVIDQWEGWLAVEGKRAASISTYSRAIRYLMGDRSPDSLTVQSVAAILRKTSHLKTATRHIYVNAMRSLFGYMKKNDLVASLPKIKVEPTDRTWWTAEQMRDIIYAVECQRADWTIEYRDYFSIMAAIGSRQGETGQLRWCDLRDGTLTFRAETTKSRKEKVVPIPQALWAQLETRRPNRQYGDLYSGYIDENYMFPHVQQASQPNRFCVLQRALKKVGLKGGLHTFRHSVSMILYRKSGCDIKSVSQILGHSPSVAMQYYQNARTIDELRSVVERVED